MNTMLLSKADISCTNLTDLLLNIVFLNISLPSFPHLTPCKEYHLKQSWDRECASNLNNSKHVTNDRDTLSLSHGS